MNINPRVYQFAPGAKTSGALVAGIKRCLDFNPSIPEPKHHWEVVSYVPVGTSTGQIVIRCKKYPNLVVTINGTNTTTTQPTASVSIDGGTSSITNIRITSADTAVLVNSSTSGISTDEAYLVEVEDAIMLYCGKGTDGGTSYQNGSLIIGFAAGRIFQAHNKNDFSENIGEWGFMAGRPICTTGTASPWLGSQGTNITYVRARTQWAQANPATNTVGVGSRNAQDASAAPLLEGVGDSKIYERFVPIAITPNATHGHSSYAKYFRARKWRIGQDPGTGTIVQGTIVPEPTSIKFAWKHTFCLTPGAGSVDNAVVLWCPTNEEITVP